MSTRKHTKALQQACEDVGWSVDGVVKGRKHLHVHVSYRDPDGVLHQRKIHGAATPGCNRGLLNFRSDCRRVLQTITG